MLVPKPFMYAYHLVFYPLYKVLYIFIIDILPCLTRFDLPPIIRIEIIMISTFTVYTIDRTHSGKEACAMNQHTEEFENFDTDYTLEEALAEAKRCLNCPKPLCQTGCPIDNQIPRFIQAIAHGNFGHANEILAERTNLPSICGRVCPREKQCEGHCIYNKAKKPPINIGKLERFAADFESINKLHKTKKIKKDQGKIAVIGSGPAGLTVAGDMSKLGYDVTVFEGQEEPGGVLLFGIPEFRLHKSIVRREIARLEDLGVHFECNTYIGPSRTIDDLMQREGFDAVFIGTGTHVPQNPALENDQVPGVLQAMALLTAVQLVDNGTEVPERIPVKAGDDVVIIGCGNVAMDAARTCIRLKANSVTVVYRRGIEQMPANQSEYEEALAEHVQFKFFSSPVAVTGTSHVEGLAYETMEITEEGKLKGTGETGVVPCNKIIYATGHKPNARLVGEGNSIAVDDSGYVIISEDPYGMTSREGVFAGGDVVHRPATVVLAMKEAKRAVDGMVKYCETKRIQETMKD